MTVQNLTNTLLIALGGIGLYCTDKLLHALLSRFMTSYALHKIIAHLLELYACDENYKAHIPQEITEVLDKIQAQHVDSIYNTHIEELFTNLCKVISMRLYRNEQKNKIHYSF